MIPANTLLRQLKRVCADKSFVRDNEGAALIFFPDEKAQTPVDRVVDEAWSQVNGDTPPQMIGQAVISAIGQRENFEGLGIRLVIPVRGSFRLDTVYWLRPSAVSTLADSVKNVSDEVVVKLMEEKKDGDRYSFGSNGAADLTFHTPGEMPFPVPKGEKPLQSLSGMVGQVVKMAACTSAARAGIDKVWFGEDEIVATDGHRLIVMEWKNPYPKPFGASGAHLALAAGWTKVEKMMDGKREVNWARHRGHLLIRGPNWQIAIPSPPMGLDEFVPYQDLVDNFDIVTWKATINTKKAHTFLSRARKLAGALGKHKDPALGFVFDGKRVGMSYAVLIPVTKDLDQRIDVCPPIFDGIVGDSVIDPSRCPERVYVDPKFMSSALDLIGANEVTIGFTQELKPICMEAASPSRRVMIMPFRVRDNPSLDWDIVSFDEAIEISVGLA